MKYFNFISCINVYQKIFSRNSLRFLVISYTIGRDISLIFRSEECKFARKFSQTFSFYRLYARVQRAGLLFTREK